MINYDLDILFFSKHKLWKLERILEVTNLDKEKFYRILEEFNQKLENQGLKKLEYKNECLAICDKIENFEETRYSINQKTFILSEVFLGHLTIRPSSSRNCEICSFKTLSVIFNNNFPSSIFSSNFSLLASFIPSSYIFFQLLSLG